MSHPKNPIMPKRHGSTMNTVLAEQKIGGMMRHEIEGTQSKQTQQYETQLNQPERSANGDFK
jgi:hypothetical protein